MNATVPGARVRAQAARVVDAVVCDGKSLDAVLPGAEATLSPAETALLRNLCYGSLRYHWRLRAWLEDLLKRRMRSRDSVIESLLCIGFYQLAEMRIPDHAAVSMTVEAARQLRMPRFASLVNAVLRNFRRGKMVQAAPPGEQARYSHPAWFIEQLKQDWPGHWRDVLRANNERAPMWLRVNRRNHTTDAYLQKLIDATNEKHTTLPGIDSAIRLVSPMAVADLPGFAAGDASVQDAAAQLAALWLSHDDGDALRILDACAAPGGKTGHLLELAAPRSTLTAVESDGERLQRVSENLQRIGLDATLRHADASKPEEWAGAARFDRILLDAPCSATGVIRRHPDIKVLRRKSDIGSLAGLQRRLLGALWPLLEPGGRLLYVTCSVLAEENDAVVEDFLQKTPDAHEYRVLPNNNIRDLMHAKTRGFQILPGTRGVDGFYFASLGKRPE